MDRRKVYGVADLERYHPGIHLEGKKKHTVNLTTVAGVGPESNPGLPYNRCVG